ncbi:hypothetical protein X975_25812, partial [Stegodyphus mimosarum]
MKIAGIKHLQRSSSFLIKYDEDSRWPLQILWTDEAHNLLTGKHHNLLTGNVKSKNCVPWADENSHNVASAPLHEAKQTVWHHKHIYSQSILLSRGNDVRHVPIRKCPGVRTLMSFGSSDCANKGLKFIQPQPVLPRL